MPTQLANGIQIGSRWVARNGQHVGRVVDVVDITSNSVLVQAIQGTKDHGNGSRGQVDKPHRRPIEAFMVQYEPLISNDDVVTYPAYRHVSAPQKKKPERSAVKMDPVTGLIIPGTTDANIEVIDISPALAQAWLDRSATFGNRPVRKSWVNSLTADIRRGAWKLTFDPIRMDEDGVVVDGQHRLLAIAQSHVSCQSLVVRGVSHDAFAVMDTGKGRSVGDILHLHGFADRFALAGAAKMLMLLEATGRPIDLTFDSRSVVTPASTVAYLRDHGDVAAGVKLAHSVRKAVEGGPGVWGAAMTLLLRVDPEQAREFAYLVSTGENMARTHPVMALRRRLMAKQFNIAFSRDRLGREELLAIIIKAWNAVRADETVDTLRFSRGKKAEPFPMPI